MIHIIIWVIMFLIWYLYRTYKASVEENEEIYRAYESTTFNNITEKEMNVETCLDERTITGLVLSTLRKIGCEPQMEQQGSNYVYFTYQGRTLPLNVMTIVFSSIYMILGGTAFQSIAMLRILLIFTR